MRHRLVAATAALLLAGPVLADPAAAGEPKTRKVCKAVNNGNPLFPEYRCHTVPVETATATAAEATPAAPANAQVAAYQAGAQPH